MVAETTVGRDAHDRRRYRTGLVEDTIAVAVTIMNEDVRALAQSAVFGGTAESSVKDEEISGAIVTRRASARHQIGGAARECNEASVA